MFEGKPVRPQSGWIQISKCGTDKQVMNAALRSNLLKTQLQNKFYY